MNSHTHTYATHVLVVVVGVTQQCRRSRAVPHRLQTIRASSTNAHPRTSRQNSKRAPPHGAHEYPAREQDRRRDSPRYIRCASPILSLLPPLVYIHIPTLDRPHTELREDSTGGLSAARATPGFRSEKSREAQRSFRTAVPHRHD
jgi:hypothetical protein